MKCQGIAFGMSGLGDVDILVDLRRIGQAIARRPGHRIGPQLRAANPARPAGGVAMQGKIDMDMVVMENIGARAEHRRECGAGTGMDVLQKSSCLVIATRPVAHDRNLPPICQAKTANVEGIAKRPFGQPRAPLVVHAPAAIGAHRNAICATGVPKPRQRGRLDHFGQPRIERRDHRTVERIGRIRIARRHRGARSP